MIKKIILLQDDYNKLEYNYLENEGKYLTVFEELDNYKINYNELLKNNNKKECEIKELLIKYNDLKNEKMIEIKIIKNY